MFYKSGSESEDENFVLKYQPEKEIGQVYQKTLLSSQEKTTFVTNHENTDIPMREITEGNETLNVFQAAETEIQGSLHSKRDMSNDTFEPKPNSLPHLLLSTSSTDLIELCEVVRKPSAIKQLQQRLFKHTENKICTKTKYEFVQMCVCVFLQIYLLYFSSTMEVELENKNSMDEGKNTEIKISLKTLRNELQTVIHRKRIEKFKEQQIETEKSKDEGMWE